MTSPAQLAYRFNGFRVDPVRRLLFGADGEPIPLKPKVFDTLLYLVERAGLLVDKRALLEAIWPNVIVEENNLNKAISTLRRVLGETRDEHRFIVTEPGRGYRFVASVEAGPAVTTEPSPARAETAVPMSTGGSVPATPVTSPGAMRESLSSAVESARDVKTPTVDPGLGGHRGNVRIGCDRRLPAGSRADERRYRPARGSAERPHDCRNRRRNRAWRLGGRALRRRARMRVRTRVIRLSMRSGLGSHGSRGCRANRPVQQFTGARTTQRIRIG